MREKTTRGIYKIWAYFYDHLCWGTIVTRRASRAIRRMNILPGERVLDIGVGTGLALPAYPRHADIVGIDLSLSMLEKARQRADGGQMDHVSLAIADGLRLPFAAETFDHILASHVITVVSDPIRLVSEIRRVAKPDAQLVIINHFRSNNRLVGSVERWLSPLFEKLGWRSDLSLQDVLARTDLAIDYRYKLDSVDLFETVFARNIDPDRGAQHLAR